MDSSSHQVNQFVQHKLLLIVILALMLLVPVIVTAQEATEEPQVDAVVTDTTTDDSTTDDTTTDDSTTDDSTTDDSTTDDSTTDDSTTDDSTTDDSTIDDSTTDDSTTDDSTTDDSTTDDSTTDDSTTDDSTTDDSTTDDSTTDAEEPVVEETPVVITSLSDDFEAWTGENWSVTDWSVVPSDNSLALFSNLANATAQVISLDWTNYSVDLDAKIEAGNTLAINFDTYSLVVASDSRNRLSQNGEVLATSPTRDNPDDTLIWHHVSIAQNGTELTITVDGIPQYTVTTTNSPLGIFAFVATGDQGVSIDNLMMTEDDENTAQIVEVISTPPPDAEIIDSSEATEEPDLLAESTEEPDLLAESTEEPDLLAESTEEPDLLAESTEEPDLLAESTEEPDLLDEATEDPVVLAVEESGAPTYVVTNIITDDFEGDLSSWNTTASIVEVADGNHVLLLPTNGQLAPVSSTTSSGVILAGQANILSDVETAGSFTVTFNDVYAVEINTTGITINENREVVGAVESTQAINTWFAFSIEATPDGFTISINDAVVAEYVGTLALDGNFAVTTNTSTMFEDVTVDSLTVEVVIEPLATPAPDANIEEIQSKVGGNAQSMINAYLDGGDEAVALFLASTSAEQDEDGRILVDILVADNYDGATIAQLVEDAGGIPTNTYSQSLEAYVDVNVIMAIGGNEGVRFIRNTNRVASTGPVGTDGTDPTWTEAYNLLSIEEWHLAGVTGQDVKVGVIDASFNGADDLGQQNGNLPCLVNADPATAPIPLFNSVGGFGSETHGTEVIEVICDIAPDSDVYMFRVDSVASVQSAISEARNPSNRMDVLVMALDLGVNTSAGGGISGDIDANVYAELEAAKGDGMVVIAAAGNNNKRMLVLKITDTNTTTININGMSTGDEIKFGWNDFDDNGDSIVTITANLDSQGDISSTDPVVNPLSVTVGNGNDDVTLNLSIDAADVDEDIYLQVQVVPASPPSSVEFDYTSIGLGGNETDITDDSNVGNLGRPADSDHVISVGAICTRPGENPTRWEFSSNGPRFASDGSPITSWDTTITQDEAKPSIMSYSFVTTNGSGFAAPEGAAPVNGLLSCTDGFGGTSASAAHVSAMTALLMSNDNNTSFADLNEANATSENTFNSIRDYLQARSIDLPLGAGADGFDATFGAGLSILGAPTYDLDDTVNLSTQADLLPTNCNGGNTFYVGQASMGNTGLDGDINSPFTSIADALNATSPECIIVMPGEYVSPLFVENSYASPLLVTGYNDVSRLTTNDVVFWLRGLYFHPDGEYDYGSDGGSEVSYKRRAGLYFGDASSNVEFSGLTFVAARFHTPLDGNGQPDEDFTSPPQAVVMDGSTDTTVSNSQFGKITLNGVEYPGWDNIDATPIQILNQAEGARLENNLFNDNSSDTLNVYPTLAVINSGASDNPVTIIGNEMVGNSADDRFEGTWGSILYIEGSHIDIINNAIHNNTGETIIKVETTKPAVDPVSTGISATHTNRARIVGNVFLNNATTSVEDTAGPLINGYYAPTMYIINNTMISNTIPTNNTAFGQLIARGNADDTDSVGSLVAGRAFWEIHNNLIFNNTYLTLVGDTRFGTTTGCDRIPNDIDSTDDILNVFAWDHTHLPFNPPVDDPTDLFHDRGAQNNWIVSNNSTLVGGAEFGACQDAIFVDKTVSGTTAFDNQNIIDSDSQPVDTRQLINDDSGSAQNGDFQGVDTTSPFFGQKSRWEYYALADTLVDFDNPNNNEFSDGIDAAKSQWLSDTGGGDVGDPYMDNADIDKDIVGTTRILNVNNWEINWLTTWDPVSSTLAIPQGISSTNSDFTVDIGAFEFSPLQFDVNCVPAECDYYDADLITNGGDLAITDGMEEDSDFITFDINTIVTGGFGELTFNIGTQPNNYGTQCGSQFENSRGLVNQGAGFGEFFDYCPPLNFYTSITNTAPDYVSFEITVSDEAGAFANGEVRFTIDPDANDGSANDDADFGDKTVAIGDELDDGQAYAQDVFEVVTTLGATPSVRLRPYTRFDNFFFSENGNPEFVDSTGKKLIDYPFTYEITDIDDPGANPILVGSPYVDGYIADLGNDPVIALELSDSNTGLATITYSVTDNRNQTSTGNILKIRSISIVPDKGLYDDTSFIWNYSDSANAPFFTNRDGSNSTEAPDSGDWQAERALGAINDTLHTTSTANDTATFRFIGTGFNVFMRGVNGGSNTFEINVFDDIDSDSPINYEVDVTSVKNWVTGTSVVNELTIALDVDSLTCTTLAGVDETDQNLLINNLDEYTITCNGLPDRKHSVQIVNTGGGTLSVDAFSIINDEDLNFADAGPIPPGFHDIDDAVLRNAFGGQWEELPDTDYSNGVALRALVAPTNVSFTITSASGFAIGTTYRNNASDFNICVSNATDKSLIHEICNIVEDNIGSAVDGVRIPFFGLDPTKNYTVTLENMDSGFVFDDLIVFDELMLPVANLPLGTTDYSDINLMLGEPFNDDWIESSGKQVIDSGRSAIGPFITFQMDEDVDMIGITADNAVTGPACTPTRKVTCPPPPPTGFNGLAVCVNRGKLADNASGTEFGNCIIIDTYDNADSESNTYHYIESGDGTVKSGGSQFITNTDGMIILTESRFDASWGNTDTIVEIFSLYPDTNIEFESVTLFSSKDGIGEGSYTVNAPGISYLEYDHSANTYTEVEIDDGGGAFNTIDVKQCIKEKKGVCLEEITVGTYVGTTGVGNAILFKTTGTGIIPRFTESSSTFARICIQSDSTIGATDPELIAAEIQAEVQAKGGCEILDLTGSAGNSPRFINGITGTTQTQQVMIELLPSPTSATPSMNVDGLDIVGGDLAGLDTLTTGQRYETSYINRKKNNQFLYTSSWETKADTDGTHSANSYDETDDAGSSVTFKTSGGNVVNIIRDLKTSTSEVCTGKKKNIVCTPGINGYSDITVCVAPDINKADRHCTVHSSDGSATQSVLPISLNTDFATGSYVVSITSSSDGFVIDAVEIFDTTTDKMTVGVYQEDSNLISYQNGQTEILKNTSFENTALLASGNDWDWNSDIINATITTDNPFIGNQSIDVHATAGQSIESETFDIIQGISYTVVARVYVAVSSTGHVEMDIPTVGSFVTQSSNLEDTWQLMRHSFVAGSDVLDAPIKFTATDGATSFYVDDVHVYKGGAWSLGSGGLNDGQLVTSSGYGSQATFMFTGTGFTVKLASDTSSGETQICYENGSKHCFTYDDEQPQPPPPVCTGSKKNIVCTTPDPETVNNGHTVTGLTSGDYIVTIQQLDNGLQTYEGADVCTTGKNPVCTPSSQPNDPNSSATTIKLDYIQIYDDSQPPVLSADTYNEDAIVSNALGMQLFPASEWEQITDANGFTNNSYYQVNDSQAVGSLLAIKVDNTEAVTIVVDINQPNANADQVLACGNEFDGAIEFNGTGYDVTSDDCAITDQALNQTQLVFNKQNLTPLSGTGGETLVTLQSLTKGEITVDGYQVIYGTTLTEGYYEEVIGASENADSILQLSNDADWNLVSNSSYSGRNALQTATNGATIDFTFEGTGVSFLMKTPEPIGDTIIPSGTVTIELRNANICTGVNDSCTDQFDLSTTDLSASDGVITIAGLPKETYDVTVTANIAGSEEVLLDAIEIFGDLQELGSLYDDAQTNVSGTPLLTFSPLWIATENDTTGNFLNNTNHTASQVGASVSFVVSGTTATEAIVIYDGNPTTASTDVEVCWSNVSGTSLAQTCSSVDLNGSTTTTVTAPTPGNYSVSITNQVNEPLVIDAIQVIEFGLMTEGIYEENSSHFGGVATTANDDAGNGFAMQVTVANPVSFTFTGVAFSALILDNSTDAGVPVLGSTNFNVCVYDGTYVASECTSGSPDINDIYTSISNTRSAVAYGGFHSDGTGTDNGEWTVVITNNDATNPLLIDRVDILGNHNELEITDGNVYEANAPQIRYLPFGSWTEQTSFKDGTPLNGDRFETAIPGSIAYFEFDDNFNDDFAGIEYVRQIQNEFTPPDVCISSKKGVCTTWQVQPTVPAYADANICYGTVGNPSPLGCPSIANDSVAAFQYSSTTSDSDCDGCWGFIQYQRDGTSNSLTPLDYIRLYESTTPSPLIAGMYQENHPNINVSGTMTSISDTNAKAGFYDLISGTVGESSFYFTFTGTGLSLRTFAGANAAAIDVCIIDYTGGAIPSHTDASTCLRTYDNVQTTDGFVTRSLHGLHHEVLGVDAQYMAILKATLDGTTAMGLDQVTIFNEQWFTETDLSDTTYLNQLEVDNSYPIDFKTRDADNLVQFFGDWQSVSEQIFVRFENEKKQQDPIFRTEEGDRALEIGAAALFRVSGSNAVTVDIELGETGSFQICGIPMTSSADFEVDITAGATCQTFTQDGRANVSHVFSTDTTAQVITIELITDTWMSLYNVALFDIVGGLSEGLYDHSAPGILYDVSLKTIINETMEDANVDWNTIGGTTDSVQSNPPVVCPKKTICAPPDPAFSGNTSRKVMSDTGQGVNIGQGIEYVGSGGTGVSLDDDTRYTAIAHVYIDPTTPGGVEMRLTSGIDTINEVDGLNLSTSSRGAWQTIRADFTTENSYNDLVLELIATGGQTLFFVDNVTLTTGGEWVTATPIMSAEVCTGKKKSLVCVPGSLQFDAYGDNYYQSTIPGASFNFDFVGTGFELGLVGGNSTGDVEVCYSNEADFANPTCFTYSQDDGIVPSTTVCIKEKKEICQETATTLNDTTSLVARGIVGLENDTWTVVVREVDDGYGLTSPTQSRQSASEICLAFKKGVCKTTGITFTFSDAPLGLDYLYIFEDINIITVPEGSYNEDAQDGSDNDYLSTYPEDSWQSFSGAGAFSNRTYTAPTKDSQASTIPGSVALVQIYVEEIDTTTAVVFQLGNDSSGLAETLLVCVDETNGKMEWDGTQFSLVDSDNCELFNDVGSTGQVSVTDDDIDVLGSVTGTHNVTVTALSTGFFRIDDYQVFDSRALAAGLHSEDLPETILNFGPGTLNKASTCDPTNEWCFTKTKTVLQDVCISFRKGSCRETALLPVEITPYLGSAAVTANSGATVNFVAYGTGFSIISDVDDNGLDFRVCYKLESANTSFPVVDSLLNPVPSPPTEESIALNGFDDGGLPVLISEGGILCENLTTDTDNWDAIMDRSQSSGEQYGFSFYGLPLAAYEVQVTVITPQDEITGDESFTFDAINVFSDISTLSALQPGLTDDSDSDISYEPSVFWNANTTSNTYENTDSTTDHAGAISQVKVEGNTLVLYQAFGDMSSDIQICLLIGTENIHCSVEAERQSRLARQVTTFTQSGDMVIEIVCINFKRGKCTETGPQEVQEVTTFTPIVFYGLGDAATHTVIMENRVQGKTFNIDALRVID